MKHIRFWRETSTRQRDKRGITEVLEKLLSYYYLTGKAGWLEAWKLFTQVELRRAQTIAHNRSGRTIYLNNDSTTVWAIQHSIDKVQRLVDQISTVEEPGIIFDVGANCGLFSLLVKARFPHAKVYAFEPSPFLQPVLRKNTEDAPGIEIVQRAVCEKDNELVTLFIDVSSQENNSLKSTAIRGTVNKTVKVETVCLDTFVRDRGIDHIDVLKVDIQGSERALIQGATRTLQITQTAFFEVSFLDADVFETVDAIRANLPEFKVVNPVMYGADLMFFRKD